jgi:hypothetical protein
VTCKEWQIGEMSDKLEKWVTNWRNEWQIEEMSNKLKGHSFVSWRDTVPNILKRHSTQYLEETQYPISWRDTVPNILKRHNAANILKRHSTQYLEETQCRQYLEETQCRQYLEETQCRQYLEETPTHIFSSAQYPFYFEKIQIRHLLSITSTLTQNY